MSQDENFSGFSKNTIDFFSKLKKNNQKEWFHAHKTDFEAYVMEPARNFVTAMGERLKQLSPDILAIPKVDKSIFRIYRDTRFSGDKSPYKIHLGIFFWEGIRPKMECPGFYFHLEPPKLMLGAGLYMFPKNSLEKYRNTVIHPVYGNELSEIAKKISRLKGYNLGGKHYKRIPSGFDASHPNAELLLFNGLHAGIETEIPEELCSSKLVNYCWQKFKPLEALHKWLVAFNHPEFIRNLS